MIEWLAGFDPRTLLAGFAVLGVLLALPLELAALARLRRAQWLRGTFFLVLGGAALLGATLAGFVAASLYGYGRLTHEQLAASATAQQLGERHYALTLALPDTPPRRFELRGDEWQIEARLLKWRGMGNLAGFDTVYRLERLAGRYSDLDMERSAPRSIHGLAERDAPDLWALVKRYHAWLPFADALYGSAAFVPLADGAAYRVSVSASGLIIRPTNEAAQRAVGAWR